MISCLPPHVFLHFGRLGSFVSRQKNKHLLITNPPSKPPAVGLATSLHLKGGALVKLFFYYMYLNTLIRFALKVCYKRYIVNIPFQIPINNNHLAPLFSYDQAYKNSPVDYFSEGASWREGVDRRSLDGEFV